MKVRRPSVFWWARLTSACPDEAEVTKRQKRDDERAKKSKRVADRERVAQEKKLADLAARQSAKGMYLQPVFNI